MKQSKEIKQNWAPNCASCDRYYKSVTYRGALGARLPSLPVLRFSKYLLISESFKSFGSS